MRRMRGPASPAPSALRPRSPSRRCAERSAVVDSGNTVRARLLTRAHTTYVAPESPPAHMHTHSLDALFLRVTLSLSAGMHGWMHTRHTATQRGGDRSPAALSSPTLFCCLFFRTFKFVLSAYNFVPPYSTSLRSTFLESSNLWLF